MDVAATSVITVYLLASEEEGRGVDGAERRGGGDIAQGHHNSSRKSPQMCRRCTVFSYPVMERVHLDELSVRELKEYQVMQNLVYTNFSLLTHLTLLLSLPGQYCKSLSAHCYRVSVHH